MTRTHWKSLSNSIKAARSRIAMGQSNPDLIVENLTRDLSAVLKADNDSFKPEIFLSACGFGVYVAPQTAEAECSCGDC